MGKTAIGNNKNANLTCSREDIEVVTPVDSDTFKLRTVLTVNHQALQLVFLIKLKKTYYGYDL